MRGALLRGMTLLMFIALSVPDASGDGQILEGIKGAYRSIEEIKGTFRQVSKLRDLGREMTFKGEFYIKIPKSLFWRYTGKDLQEVYVNDTEFIIYQKRHRQAIRTQFDERTFGQAPIALLSGLANIDRDYDPIEKEGFVRLIPRSSFKNLRYIDLYPSEEGFPIKRFVILDNRHNEIEIHLDHIEMNPGIDEAIFRFIPPEGVNVIDQ